jgi:hypothetical protein
MSVPTMEGNRPPGAWARSSFGSLDGVGFVPAAQAVGGREKGNSVTWRRASYHLVFRPRAAEGRAIVETTAAILTELLVARGPEVAATEAAR